MMRGELYHEHAPHHAPTPASGRKVGQNANLVLVCRLSFGITRLGMTWHGGETAMVNPPLNAFHPGNEHSFPTQPPKKPSLPVLVATGSLFGFAAA